MINWCAANKNLLKNLRFGHLWFLVFFSKNLKKPRLFGPVFQRRLYSCVCVCVVAAREKRLNIREKMTEERMARLVVETSSGVPISSSCQGYGCTVVGGRPHIMSSLGRHIFSYYHLRQPSSDNWWRYYFPKLSTLVVICCDLLDWQWSNCVIRGGGGGVDFLDD